MMLMHSRNQEKRNQRIQKNKWHIAASIVILSGMPGKMIFKRYWFMKKLISGIKWTNKMKYLCQQYDFKLFETRNTFDEVLVHEKTNPENNKLKTLRMKIK